jgi:hypothetical protein
MLTLALLAATGNFEEIPMHVRATPAPAPRKEDVMQAFLHVAVYAGVPKANHAIKLAKTDLCRDGGEMTDPCFRPPDAAQAGGAPVARDPDYKTSVTRSPTLPLLSMESTPSEETGPRFGHSLIGALDNNLILNYTRALPPPSGSGSASMAGCWTRPGAPCRRRWSRSGRPMRAGAIAT